MQKDKREVQQHADEIENNVLTALVESDKLDAAGISIRVERGVVTLIGQVNTQAERDAAGQIAQAVEGVGEVQNELIAIAPESPDTIIQA